MQRKLTAILSADVVGYSGLMEADETGTLERLKANRVAIFDPQVATHGGRVFKLMGDGALVEFSSVVSAVNCALAIQAATEKAGAQDAKPIRYRIGVNLGDIIIDGDDIYGEGVNVAARLQTLAPVGGVALSKTVRDHVEGKAPCTFEDMGEHAIKNIERPVHVFSVRVVERSGPENHKVEERPRRSICVLPFANMSGDIEQEYFSDGISEDITTDLSKVSALKVSARNTAFTFKGKSVRVPQVARELNVSYVLEGSVRKAGGRVRITAQLIDGVSGNHIWAERYDRDLKDIFALQDEISEAIVKALKLKLLPEEKKAIEKRGTESAEAYNLYLMARQHRATLNLGNRHRHEEVAGLCRRAIEIDPNYARAWALLAYAQWTSQVQLGGTGDYGREAGKRALALDGSLGEAHAVNAEVLGATGDLTAAREEIEAALRLDPQSYEVNMMAGIIKFGQLLWADAIPYFEKAASLEETNSSSLVLVALSYAVMGNDEAAREAARRALPRTEKILAKEPDNGNVMASRVQLLALLDEKDRAKELASRALQADPDNVAMKWNLGLTFLRWGEVETALDLFAPGFERGIYFARSEKFRMLFTPIRDHPRFKAIVASAEARWEEEASAIRTASA